ncbi:MAG: tRNA (N6-isopentenyl adenosine(37)-C2)-methylthiotransferase MiaB [Erysipelotrichaceae bacterium]|jgi:tRNA-2-methylthio-N6-dimethylallyladenosine synthase|nr:tRNA (N6-isopentenyl adenosine(37)-C2)-methylthiotransferase MiaB [Erysipelotrichaceae bacterium]
MKTRVIAKPDLKLAAKRGRTPTTFHRVNNSSNTEIINKLKNRKYFIKTYGCQANVRDEETMRGILESVGMISTDNVNESDLIIINTCAVRENAEDKVYGEVGNLKHLKAKKKDLVIAICGCMVEQPEILDRLINTFKEVNLYFGTHEIYNLASLVYETLTSGERIVSIESKAGEVVEDLPSCRNNKFKAFVNIMYGCDKFCTYCIVPYTRGKERSRRFEDVMKEVKELEAQGYQEVTFLGQNVNAYGKDLDEGYDFADLLVAAGHTNIPRIRFTTSHPWDFNGRMIEAIAKYPNIMKFIHLPVQSGSSEVLKRMNRRYTREDYLNLVKKMKDNIPGLTLSTDIIVGFPNETDEEFNDTLTLVDEVGYDAAFTFIYSPRRGTPAAKMEDPITYETKVKRFKELVSHLENSISKKSNEMIGKVYPVLVEGVSKTNKDMFSGYTENNKLVHFKADETLVGQIVNVKITESHTYSMLGELVK